MHKKPPQVYEAPICEEPHESYKPFNADCVHVVNSLKQHLWGLGQLDKVKE